MADAEHYGITGGSGYVGYRLALALLRQQPNATVRLLDIRPPPLDSSNGDASSSRASSPFPCHPSHLSPAESRCLSYVHCDLTSVSSVDSSLTGVTFVYHVASYGMSGSEQLDREVTAAVNVAGTAHLLSACRRHRIRHLVYVSSYNVVYNGTPIRGGDESLPYPSLSSHTDTYSQTKTIAEQLIRSASHDPAHPLRVCVLRPAAIYGDGEQRHLPRILRLVQRGLAVFAIGSEDVLCDWVYCDNLVYALALAQRRLREDERLGLSVSTSRVYFISDDAPINNFTFLSAIIRPLHLPPTFLFYVPTRLMLAVALAIEVVHAGVSRALPSMRFSPFLTRAEVLKVGREHWMRVERAKKELGWEVVVDREEAVRRCVEWYEQAGYGSGRGSRGPAQVSSASGAWAGWTWRSVALLVLLLAVVVGLWLWHALPQ